MLWPRRAVQALVAAGLSLCTGATLAAPALFEDLQWGATEAQIRAVFADRLSVVPCSQEQRLEQAARANARACGSPVLENYTIDGISFVAFFNMGGEGGSLNTIYLDRAATVTNAQIRKGEGADFRYKRVKQQLYARHGAATEVNEPSRWPKNAPVILHSKWIVDGTVISVTDTILPDPRGQMYYLGVVYKPLSEAMKPLPGS